jgi:hypothetical protein
MCEIVSGSAAQFVLKDGVEGLSVVPLDEARARIEAKRERRQAERT